MRIDHEEEEERLEKLELASLCTAEDLFRHMQEYYHDFLYDNLQPDIVKLKDRTLILGGPVNGYKEYMTRLHQFVVMTGGRISYSSTLIHPVNVKEAAEYRFVKARRYSSIEVAMKDELDEYPICGGFKYEPWRRYFGPGT